MSELDFTAKYKVNSNDEFGMLGNSINVLSEKLEHSLDELKQANEELKEDLKQREAMDEMRKEFLSNVSHELKTPIALIQGYAEGLIDNINDDEESRQFYCEVIMDEAKKMNNMVRQIMALNQLEFGYSQVSLEDFDIVDMIHGVLNRSDILIRQKEANVHFEAPEPVYVNSDAFMVEEVFTNYFTNALNHVDNDRRIDISIEKHDDIVRVNVFNSGDPIPEEDIGNIWDKFYKVDKARTREYGGSGVGLSIVKATMQLLGKDYGVKNLENGVLFWYEMDKSSDAISTETEA
jgi:signal transduction histidine kinase